MARTATASPLGCLRVMRTGAFCSLLVTGHAHSSRLLPGIAAGHAHCRVALGMAFAIVTILWLRTVFNDYVLEITLTLTSAYMAFFVVRRRLPRPWRAPLYMAFFVVSHPSPSPPITRRSEGDG